MTTPHEAADVGLDLATIPDHETLKARLDKVAWEIGRSAVDHLKLQYPAALEAVTKNAQLSLRNHIRNQINWKMGPLINALEESARASSPQTKEGV